MAENTSFIIDGRSAYDNGVKSVRIRYLRSTRSNKTTEALGGYTQQQIQQMTRQQLEALVSECSAVATNELPNILNTIKNSGLLDNLSMAGFDYSFDLVFD